MLLGEAVTVGQIHQTTKIPILFFNTVTINLVVRLATAILVMDEATTAIGVDTTIEDAAGMGVAKTGVTIAIRVTAAIEVKTINEETKRMDMSIMFQLVKMTHTTTSMKVMIQSVLQND